MFIYLFIYFCFILLFCTLFIKEKKKIRKNKVTYIGICILKLNRVLTYDFHYYYMKNKYGNKSRLLFTDTNSLMYEIISEDVYKDFSNNIEMC